MRALIILLRDTSAHTMQPALPRAGTSECVASLAVLRAWLTPTATVWPSWRPAHCGRCDWCGLRGLPLARLHCAVAQVGWLLLAIVLVMLLLIVPFYAYLFVPIDARWACSGSSCSWLGSSTGHLHALLVVLGGTVDVGIVGCAAVGRLTMTQGSYTPAAAPLRVSLAQHWPCEAFLPVPATVCRWTGRPFPFASHRLLSL